MKTITIKVDKRTIMAANYLVHKDGTTCACHCPVSLALNQQTDYHGWFVAPCSGKAEAITMTLDGTRRFKLPKIAKLFLEKWEQNSLSVEPFEFKAPCNRVQVDF